MLAQAVGLERPIWAVVCEQRWDEEGGEDEEAAAAACWAVHKQVAGVEILSHLLSANFLSLFP